MGGNDRLQRLRQAVRQRVPCTAGIYVWLGATRERLYVGKSRNLQVRMLSYLAPAQLHPDARQRHLVSAIEDFEFRQTPGELMALLLEDALIKEFNPRHNERQKDYRERTYLLLTDDAFPTCLMGATSSIRPGTEFGPFKDEYFVRDLKSILTDVMGLRACVDREPFRRSARFDLDQCLGPCRGGVSPEQYALVVSRARQFLEGDPGWVTRRLGEMMAEASGALRFERAAELRDLSGFCERFGARQRFFQQFDNGELTVHEPGEDLRYRMVRGCVAEVVGSDGGRMEIPAEVRARPADRRFLLDRANVVYAWLGAH